jgi:CheY-like chemotaxis protein
MTAMQTSSTYSVLLADDDRLQLDTLEEILEPQGFRTLRASDGEEALEIACQEIVHVALFDVNMPKLTGLETLQLLRQFNILLPVILITADSSSALLRQAIQASASSVIPKPVSKNVVLYTLTRILGRNYGQDSDRSH